jgi:peptide-methionine (R)-S-oxide reductase
LLTALTFSSAAEFAKISDSEWQTRLTKEEFYVTRKKGTERAFTG